VMSRRLIAVILLIIVPLVFAGCISSAQLSSPDFSKLYKKTQESVVQIKTKKYVDEKDGLRIERHAASGVVMASRRIAENRFETRVLTNFHVVRNQDELYVHTADGKQYRATILGYDELRDLASLTMTTSQQLQPVVLGESEKLNIGDWAYLIGNPLGIPWSLSVGRIGNIGKNPLYDTIQFDGGLNKGNSGGALFNTKGELVGISHRVGGDNIGFAISARIVKQLWPALERGEVVSHGYIGVTLTEIGWLDQATARALGLSYPPQIEIGVVISDVVPYSSAFFAGLMVGDIIVAIARTKITTVEDAQDAIARSGPGTQILLTIIRGNLVKDFIMPVESAPVSGNKGPADAALKNS